MEKKLQLVATPLASLFLILTILAGPATYERPGFRIYIPYSRSCSGSPDTRSTIATSRKDDTVQLDWYEPIPFSSYSDTLGELYRTRAEKFLFVRAEPDLPWEDFMRMIDVSSRKVDMFVWITPGASRHIPSGGC